MSAADTTVRADAPRWSLAQRVAFRFVFSYAALYFVTAKPFNLIPGSHFLVEKYVACWYAAVVWVGKNVLRTSYDIYLLDSGSGIGNTAFGSILFLCYLVAAVVATVVWSMLDRRRPHYQRLHQGLRLVVRCSLALTMIHYGALKVIPVQMISPPPLGVLTQRVGDLTRMRLLWLFMGASPQYESLTGLAELLGGVLLLVPRTTLLGALLCAGNLAMVFTLNMCFDVQVKLYSLHLFFMSLVLIAPDAGRLANLLLLNRRAEPAPTPRLFARRWLDLAPHVLIFLLGAYAIVGDFREAWRRYQEFHPPRPPLYGVWKVEKHSVGGEEVPEAGDAKRWQYVFFRNPGAMSVEHQAGTWEGYGLDLDLAARTMALRKLRRDAQGQLIRKADGTFESDATVQGALSFEQPDPDVLVLSGSLDGAPVEVQTRKMALLATGFHWIFDPGRDSEP